MIKLKMFIRVYMILAIYMLLIRQGINEFDYIFNNFED